MLLTTLFKKIDSLATQLSNSNISIETALQEIMWIKENELIEIKNMGLAEIITLIELQLQMLRKIKTLSPTHPATLELDKVINKNFKAVIEALQNKPLNEYSKTLYSRLTPLGHLYKELYTDPVNSIVDNKNPLNLFLETIIAVLNHSFTVDAIYSEKPVISYVNNKVKYSIEDPNFEVVILNDKVVRTSNTQAEKPRATQALKVDTDIATESPASPFWNTAPLKEDQASPLPQGLTSGSRLAVTDVPKPCP